MMLVVGSCNAPWIPVKRSSRAEDCLDLQEAALWWCSLACAVFQVKTVDGILHCTVNVANLSSPWSWFRALTLFLLQGSQCCFREHLLPNSCLYLCLTSLGHLESWSHNQIVNEKPLSVWWVVVLWIQLNFDLGCCSPGFYVIKML